MKIIVCLLFALIVLCTFISAQPFAAWTKTELKLSNGVVERLVQLPGDKGNFLTTSYKPVTGTFKYFTTSNPDFQFSSGGIVYSGNSNWILKAINHFKDEKQGDGAAVTIVSEDNKIELTVQFLLYPGQPVVRKNLVFKNLDEQPLQLESVDIEKFNVTGYGATTFSWVCHDYGRRRSIGPYDW